MDVSGSKGNSMLLETFDKDVFNQMSQGELMPYRYGSYFFYKANNQSKQFFVSSFVNLTSQDVSAMYP